MTRLVFPNLFEVWGAPIVVGDTPQQALRWMLADEVGLPVEHFQVWGWVGALPVRSVTLDVSTTFAGVRVVSWDGGPAAAVQVFVDVAAGATAVLRGHSGPRRSGQVADTETVVGPVTGRSVVLSASAIASVTVTGASAISPDGSLLPHAALLTGAGWRLLERVGLPADKRFDGLYPTTPQGPAGIDLDPLEAARRRVKAGTPDRGWGAVTDRGAAAPPFRAPDPEVLVIQELSPLLNQVAGMLAEEPAPARHAATLVALGMRAPVSIHGVDAPARWQGTAGGMVAPLGALRLAAGTDPYAALALGFGTTVDPRRKAASDGGRPGRPTLPPRPDAGRPRAIALPRVQLFMATVQHRVVFDLAPLGEIELEGEFTGFHLASPAEPVDPPAALAATRSGLDRPAAVDRPWLEVAEVSWNAPVLPAGSRAAPVTYAVLRADGGLPPVPVLEPRLSGGVEPFVHAGPADGEPPARVRFGDGGIPEAFPAEPPGLVYSVAAQDWFGRWSGWSSVDHQRGVVAPQVPAVRAVTVTPQGGGGPVAASLTVDVVWDWANRTPEALALRVLLHRDGDPSPPGDGSVLAVGGALVADHVVDFTGATPDTAPAGAVEIVEERAGSLRVYQVTVGGLALDQAAFDRIRVTVQARASERVRPGVAGAFSPPSSTLVTSPLPPPAPFVPAAMVWASLPDPAGISRVRLTWAGAAPSYAVYVADETAIARELDLPSPDLATPAADRLVALRPAAMTGARRAFRRLADGLTAPALAVELPRGSRLIHLYGVVGISGTGVESPLPDEGNAYLAVAMPALLTPQAPMLVARERPGGVRLHVEVAEPTVAVDRVEVLRVRGRHRAGTPEAAGPPILVLTAATGERSGGVVRWVADDPGPLPPWEPLYYRARAWAAADPVRGEVPGRSEPTAAVEAVVAAAGPPVVADLTVEALPGEPGVLLASFAGPVPGARTHRGVHRVTVTVVRPGPVVSTRRAAADALLAHVGALPAAADVGDDAVFLHKPADLATARVWTRVPDDSASVLVEVADPSGRVSRATWSAP